MNGYHRWYFWLMRLNALKQKLHHVQELFHHEKGHSPEEKAARIAEVLADIETTGTYVHTFDELQHGTTS